MNGTYLRRALLLSLVLLTASWLPGCELLQGDEGWESFPRALALPYVWRVVSGDEIQRRCPPNAGMITNACAVRAWGDGLCYIYAEDDEQHSPFAAHEEKHCRGYNHAAQYAMPDVRFR